MRPRLRNGTGVAPVHPHSQGRAEGRGRKAEVDAAPPHNTETASWDPRVILDQVTGAAGGSKQILT